MGYPSEMKSTAATLKAYVDAVRAQGFVVLEYETVSPVHMPDSWHYYHLAGDVNWPGGGQTEIDKTNAIAYPLAKEYGLSVTCGLEGYVAGHSGANFHLHVDVGAWSNIGHGPFLTPWAGKDTHNSSGGGTGGDGGGGGGTGGGTSGGAPDGAQTITATPGDMLTIFMPTEGAA